MRKVVPALAIVIALASCGDTPTSEDFTSTDNSSTTPKTVSRGENLFKQNCRVCHTPEKALTGPALKGVLARWDNDTARVRAFIKNSAKLIREGDPRAVQVYNDWNKVSMTPMTHLSDEQIDLILEYIEAPAN